jgi:NTP pyrophosphatase (non-canonical NTP hydrolase)
MEKRTWLIIHKNSGVILERVKNYNDAVETIRKHEKADKEEGIYTEGAYEIVSRFENTDTSDMTFNEYQQFAMTTTQGIADDLKIIYPTLGLAGEAGEVVEKVKKVLRNDKGKFSSEKRVEIAKEIGDVVWYCAVLANNLGFKFSEIAEINRAKVQDRVARGVINSEGDNR